MGLDGLGDPGIGGALGQSKTRGPIGGAMTNKQPYGLAISSPLVAGNGAMVQKLEKIVFLLHSSVLHEE
jgi:hypothetical protein